MQINYVDQKHEENFKRLVDKYSVDMTNPDYVLPIYLLSAVEECVKHIDELLVMDYPGHLLIVPDVLTRGWPTGTSKRIIRLAYHLYSWKAPTTQYGDDLVDYLPMELLCGGYDEKRKKAVFEAIRMLMYWT